MKRKIQIFFIMIVVFMLSGSIYNIVPPANLTIVEGQQMSTTVKQLHLIKSPKDYNKFGFDDLGIYYTDQGLTSLNMPFVVEYTKSGFSLSDSDMKSNTKTYSENYNRRTVKQQYDVLSIKGNYAVINYHMDLKASTDKFSVDFIPQLYKTSYNEFAWWNSSWNYYRKYTINHSKIDNDLSNFPVLVKIDSNIGALCDSGDSLRFVLPDNTTELSFEIDEWNSSGTSYVWVKIPSISSTVDTNFLMYYNNSCAVDGQNVHDVWSNGYVMVQHMKDNTTSDILDSTSNNNDGTKKGVNEPIENVSSIIGSGQDFDNIDDYIQKSGCTNLPSNGNDLWSMSIILKPNTKVNGDTLFSWGTILSGGGAGNIRAMLRYSDAIYFWGGASDKDFGTDLTLDSWNHITFTYNSSVLHGYKNSNSIGSAVLAMNNIGGHYIQIGGGSTMSGWHSYFDGTIDEVRLSNVTRNSSWIKSCYENIENYDTFMCVSVQVVQPPDENVTINVTITYNEISFNETQFVITILFALFCIFMWIGYTIPAMEGMKKQFHYMPFSGGLFVLFAGFDFVSLAILLTLNYSLGLIGGFLTMIGIILIFYGILKTFWYSD